jgi:flagellar protein FlaG
MSLNSVSGLLTGSSAVSRSESVSKPSSNGLTVAGAVIAQLQSNNAPQVDVAQLQAAVESANKFLKPVASNLQFSIDEDSGKTIVKVTDISTNEVIRQIPSPEMLAISKALGRFQGLFVEQKA